LIHLSGEQCMEVLLGDQPGFLHVRAQSQTQAQAQAQAMLQRPGRFLNNYAINGGSNPDVDVFHGAASSTGTGLGIGIDHRDGATFTARADLVDIDNENTHHYIYGHTADSLGDLVHRYHHQDQNQGQFERADDESQSTNTKNHDENQDQDQDQDEDEDQHNHDSLPNAYHTLRFAQAQAQPKSQIPCCNSTTPNFLSVDGQGIVKFNTSLARVALGTAYEGMNETAAQAMNQVAGRALSMVKALKKFVTVRELQTTSVNLNALYSYPTGKPPVLDGYRAETQVSFLVPTVDAGATIDAAVDSGATTVTSINFESESPVVAAARSKAIQLAVEDAALQAGAVLAVLNVIGGKPQQIEVTSVSPPAVNYLSLNMQAAAPHMMAMMRSLPIEGGTQSVTATVKIKYAMD